MWPVHQQDCWIGSGWCGRQVSRLGHGGFPIAQVPDGEFFHFRGGKVAHHDQNGPIRLETQPVGLEQIVTADLLDDLRAGIHEGIGVFAEQLPVEYLVEVV